MKKPKIVTTAVFYAGDPDQFPHPQMAKHVYVKLSKAEHVAVVRSLAREQKHFPEVKRFREALMSIRLTPSPGVF